MNTTYFEGRLVVSTRMMHAATDSCARLAHKGLANGYRVLVAAAGLSKSNAGMAPLSPYKLEHALAEWADDGGPHAGKR